MSAPSRSPGSSPSGRRFATTRWSLVLSAGREPSASSRDALAGLCGAYWYPLYAFVRRKGLTEHQAQDLTQAFFCRLIEKRDLASVRREKGKFRSFLMAAITHYLANDRDRSRRRKRGGDKALYSLDLGGAENRYRAEPVDLDSAERLFDRRWALTVLERTLARLREEHVKAGKEGLFDRLKEALVGDGQSGSNDEIGRELGMSAGAIKTAIHRLRRRYRHLIRAEIAETVARPEEIDDEIRNLFAALRGPGGRKVL